MSKRNGMILTVKVLRGFNGLRGEIVETITRKAIRRGGYHGRGRDRYFEDRYHVINYKGKLHKVFALPSSYDDLSGLCISVDRY